MSRNWLAPKVTAPRVQLYLLLLLVLAAIGGLAALAASPHGVTAALTAGIWSAALAAIILRFLPMGGSTMFSKVLPGPPGPAFELASDIKVTMQVLGNLERRRLVSQTGQPGQPGSTHVTEESGLVLTTTVVSSDPPRKLVTTTTSPRGQRIDIARTYTPVTGGTLLEVRTRYQMTLFLLLITLFLLLLRPLFKSEREANLAEENARNARLGDYLESVAAPSPQVTRGSSGTQD